MQPATAQTTGTGRDRLAVLQQTKQCVPGQRMLGASFSFLVKVGGWLPNKRVERRSQDKILDQLNGAKGSTYLRFGASALEWGKKNVGNQR